jgi:hypothetical protein
VHIFNDRLTEPVFVNLLRSPGIDFPILAGRYDSTTYLSYRPARLHRLVESIPGLHKRLQIRALVAGSIFLSISRNISSVKILNICIETVSMKETSLRTIIRDIVSI